MVKELHVNITDLEAQVVSTTPPEELEHKENELKDVVAHLTALEEECQKFTMTQRRHEINGLLLVRFRRSVSHTLSLCRRRLFKQA